MVLGSMDAFIGLVTLAQSRGIYVISCDGYEGGRAKALADAAYTIDVRDTAAIAEVCREEHVDGIITSFSDLLAECMVNIADAAGLACYATPERFRYLREKPLMKQMFDELGVPMPLSAVVRKATIAQDIAPLGFPCVVKPVNGYGSRGIYVLENVEQVRERFDEIASYSTFDYILAEQYMDGFEFNMMNWIDGGEVYTLGIADREKTFEIPFAVPHVSRNVYPSRLIGKVYDEARQIVARIASYVGIETGPLCMQFFYSPKHGLRVCEAAGRLFGYEHELIEIASGFSIEKLLLDYVYDRSAMHDALASHSPFFEKCSAVVYFHGYEGVVHDVSAALEAESLPGVVDTLLFYEPGQLITHGVGAMPYVVRYYLRAETREQLDSLTAELYAKVKVLDADGNNLLYANKLLDYERAEPGFDSAVFGS